MLTETVNGVTYTYTYDTYGNIRSVSDGVNTYAYTYGDSNWKDLLTAYCGQSITYDQIGNPTHWYNGNNFTWVNGRRLATITASSGGTVASYTYDVDGLRQTKTVGGVEHRYVWQGNKLVSEYWDGKELEFFYDESGMPYAFLYKSSSNATPVFYYYVTNLQGDVVKILTASGTEVANYSYNAWGKLLSSSGTMASVNPIRYRGYYFDAETGFYYLVSRYYDPQICRFVNADNLASTGQGLIGCNMFTYCGNNPVCRIDFDGEDWESALRIGTALVVIGVLAAITIGTGGAGALVLAGVGVTAAAANATIAAGTTVVLGSIIIAAAEHGGDKRRSSGLQSKEYSGKSTRLKDGGRIDYEYNGNGTGNIHYQGKAGKYKICDFNNGKWNKYDVPKVVQRAIETKEGTKALANYMNKIKQLSGF